MATKAILAVAISLTFTVLKSVPPINLPMSNADTAMGAVKPAMIDIQPATKPTAGCTQRVRYEYSPPETGSLFAIAPYAIAPQMACNPPTNQTINTSLASLSDSKE